MAATKARNVRIDDWLWEAVQQAAEERHMTASEVVRRALIDYVHDEVREAVTDLMRETPIDQETENDQENEVDQGSGVARGGR